MDSSVCAEIDRQVSCLQQAQSITKSLREKCKKLESEKNEALERCIELEATIERIRKEECANCNALTNKLGEERKKIEFLKKEEKAKLLKTIAKMVENLDDPNTNPMTNAHQLFTQLVCDSLETSPVAERRGKKRVNLIEENDCEDEADSKILVNETIVCESEESSDDYIPRLGGPMVVPETEAVECFVPKSLSTSEHNRPKNVPTSSIHPVTKTYSKYVMKENKISSEEEAEMQQIAKKSKCSPVLSGLTKRNSSPSSYKSPLRPLEIDIDRTVSSNQSAKSPSVLSELIDACDHGNSRLVNGSEENRATTWKMKPSVLVESNSETASGKKMKQMTLSLTRAERKQDISLSGRFKGGVAGSSKLCDQEKDMIFPSPERPCKKGFVGNTKTLETMEDPDLTMFNPAVTSTCLPAETSFDRLPQVQNSPTYKYRRETVRKKEERLKLPGQDCDECMKYYEAAGINDSQELRSRMNTCSRHRDKYQIRAQTPPGFWNPVMPTTPEGSQEL